MKPRFILLYLALCCASFSSSQVINADPTNYTSFIQDLKAGDTLLLAAGVYMDRLNIHDVIGQEGAEIVIQGSGDSTIFIGNACCNTVSLKGSAYITIKKFTIDGLNIPYIDAVKAEGHSNNWTHDIFLDSLTIIGHGGHQQTNGISTKCPSWNWKISHCIIDGAGTGIYLGNSNGEEPFVNGLIEYNLIKNTLGYNMQVKHQNIGSRNAAGMPVEGKTIIRHNVLSKAENASLGGNARPNLLVGAFPASGVGENDNYEIYGNLFWQNPTESLFQGTGNISFYNNVCVNSAGGYGVSIQSHNGIDPRRVNIFHNTILSAKEWGIRLYNTDPAFEKHIVGNAVFSDHTTPIRLVGRGTKAISESENVIDIVSNAARYVTNPSSDISQIDFYPIVGSPLKSNVIDQAFIGDESDFSFDFNGLQKSWIFRGAYSSEGDNDGWKLALQIKSKRDSIMTYLTEFNRTDLESFKIFPNPVLDGKLIVSSDEKHEQAEFRITNNEGEVMLWGSVVNINSFDLDLSGFPKGTYYVSLISKGNIETKLIFIE